MVRTQRAFTHVLMLLFNKCNRSRQLASLPIYLWLGEPCSFEQPCRRTSGRSSVRCCTLCAFHQHSHLATDGARAGVTAEGVKAAARGTKQMTLQEARQILGVESGATWDEVVKVWYPGVSSSCVCMATNRNMII